MAGYTWCGFAVSKVGLLRQLRLLRQSKHLERVMCNSALLNSNCDKNRKEYIYVTYLMAKGCVHCTVILTGSATASQSVPLNKPYIYSPVACTLILCMQRACYCFWKEFHCENLQLLGCKLGLLPQPLVVFTSHCHFARQ